MKEKESAAWKLFNLYWKVSIPRTFLYAKRNSLIGSIQYDNDDYKNTEEFEMCEAMVKCMEDEDSSNNPELCLVTLYSQGARITFHDPDKAKELYHLIIEHLNDFKKLVVGNLNTVTVPEEDLVLLDDLAEGLFRYVRGMKDRSSFSRTNYFSKFSHRAGVRRVKKELEQVKAGYTVEERAEMNLRGNNLEEHKPISRQILEHLYRKR